MAIGHYNNRGVAPLNKEDKMACKVVETNGKKECKVEAHNEHICFLKLNGLNDILGRVTDKPTVECRHCGAKANSMEYVCAASLEDDAPCVEGGHGTVDVEEAGKPHEGGKAK
jgi:hypothetical protein